MATTPTNPSAISRYEAGLSGSERILWVDCEFTGLSVEDDHILEIAAVVSDYRLREIAIYSAFVAHDIGSVTLRMEQDEWWPSRPEHRQAMLDGMRDTGKPLRAVEAELCKFTERWCGSHDVVLAGNSVYNDRGFLLRNLPEFGQMLGHRMLDVTGFKLVTKALLGVEYQKTTKHRAASDIRESIAELKFTLGLLSDGAVSRMLSETAIADDPATS